MRITQLHKAITRWPIKVDLPDDPIAAVKGSERLRRILLLTRYDGTRIRVILEKYHEPKTIFADRFLEGRLTIKSANNPVVSAYNTAIEQLSELKDKKDIPDRQKRAAETEVAYLRRRLDRIYKALATMTEAEARQRPIREMLARQLFYCWKDIDTHLKNRRADNVTNVAIYQLLSEIFNYFYKTGYFTKSVVKGFCDEIQNLDKI